MPILGGLFQHKKPPVLPAELLIWNQRHEEEMELMPTTSSSWTGGNRWFRLHRRAKVLFALVLSLSFTGFLWNAGVLSKDTVASMTRGWVAEPQDPPLYERFYEHERNLPQLNKSLPFPEGETGRYFFPANRVWGLGWNNALQEHILLAYLAYAANRSLVFLPYAWDPDPTKNYSDYNGNLIPARIPLSAILTGPAVGASFQTDSPVPRAVIKDYWDQVCPQPTVIKSIEVNEPLGQWPGAATIVESWVKRLRNEDRCVEIDPFSYQVFDWMTFGHESLLTIWPALSQSPILEQFGWSSLIMDALRDNIQLITPPTSFLSGILSGILPAGKDSESGQPQVNNSLSYFPGLLAIHVRRGDFKEHCDKLANWSSTFLGYSQLPSLPDRFEVPPGGGWGTNTPENIEIYMRHCLPSIEQIVARVLELSQLGIFKNIKKVYIMTNGQREWVKSLKSKLEDTMGWSVSSSRDMALTREQKYIAQAIDTAIGQRAEVFIGNGFSSLSANTAMLRMANERDPLLTRFW